MATGFKCDKCEHVISAWDEGNPYYFDEEGKKQYAYHPSSDRNKCIGNDPDYVCLDCAKEFILDRKVPSKECPECASLNICKPSELEGKKCPSCKEGTLKDIGMVAIS